MVCRQVTMDFARYKDFEIIIAKSEMEYRVDKLHEILPEGFEPDNLRE